jgi:hypothetical protein
VAVFDGGEYAPMKWSVYRIVVRLQGARYVDQYLFVPFRRAGPDQWLVFRAKERQL